MLLVVCGALLLTGCGQAEGGGATAGDGPAPPVTLAAASAADRTVPLSAPTPLDPEWQPAKIPGLEPDHPPAFDARILGERARTLVPLYRQLLDAVDETQIDPTELNFAQAFDPDRIIRFVTREIAFEQYSGLLRGAEGALIGRAGNALDQSLLLGRLLNEAGYEWRIAAGELAESDAERLVAQIASQTPGFSAPGDVAQIRAIMDDVLAAQGLDAGQRSTLYAQLEGTPDAYHLLTDADTRFVVQALRDGGVSVGDAQGLERLVAEARSYYWVEYRLDAYHSWRAAHPAFAGGEAPQVDRRETFREPPEDLQHRLRISVYAEQKEGDALRVYPIVAAYERSTAALAGRPISYQNLPHNASVEAQAGIDELLADNVAFLPVIDGEVAGKAFDLDGRTFDPGLLAMDASGTRQLLQAQARQLESAIGGITGTGAPDPGTDDDNYFALTAVWIEYTLIAPGGDSRTHRRYLMDRLGVENRAAGRIEFQDPRPVAEAARMLLGGYNIAVITHRYSPTYTLQRYARLALARAELIDLVTAAPDLSTVRQHPDVLDRLVPITDVLLANALDAGIAERTDLRAYRHLPLLAVHSRGSGHYGRSGTAADPIQERVDLVSNDRRIYHIGSGTLKMAPQESIRAGVWDTFAERAPLVDTSHATGTRTAMRAALAQNVPIRVLAPGDAGLIDQLELSGLARADLRRELDRGNAVIVPARPVDGQPIAWWRVNPSTGNTLGVVEGGYGSTATEYAIFIGGQLFTALLGYAGYNACMASGGSSSCCLLDAVLWGSLGFVFGMGMIGAEIATGVSVLIVDLGYNVSTLIAGGMGGLPSTCPSS